MYTKNVEFRLKRANRPRNQLMMKMTIYKEMKKNTNFILELSTPLKATHRCICRTEYSLDRLFRDREKDKYFKIEFRSMCCNAVRVKEFRIKYSELCKI